MATTTPYWQLEKEYYTIADNADVVLRVIEHSAVTTTENGFPLVVKTPTKVHEFKVNRAILSQGSSYFDQLLNRAPETLAEATSDQNVLDVTEDGNPAVRALEIWFKIVHDKAGADTLELGIDGLWHVVAVANKYGFCTSTEAAAKWFDDWYNRQSELLKFSYKHYTTLLYPAYVFDHCAAFAQATKYLVYHNTGGNILDHQPRDFTSISPENVAGLHMPPDVMQHINSARTRLKTILHRTLYSPIDRLLKNASCTCAPNVLYNYESSLARTGVWPLESKLMNDSILSAMHDLKSYDGQYWEIQTCGSSACTFGFGSTVSTAKSEVGDYFQGLCLDCMKTSASSDADKTYWTHSALGVTWDHGCRISHGQPSWYFSFMGPREDMMDWVKGPKDKPMKDRKDSAGDDRSYTPHQNPGYVSQYNDLVQQQPNGSEGRPGAHRPHQPQRANLPTSPYQRQEYHEPQHFGHRGQNQNYERRGRGMRGNGNSNFFDPSRYGKRRGGSGRGMGMGMISRDVRNEPQTQHEETKQLSPRPDGAADPDPARALPKIQVEVADLKISGDGEGFKQA